MAMQKFVCSVAFDDDESQQILKGNMVMCSVHASVLHGCLKRLGIVVHDGQAFHICRLWLEQSAIIEQNSQNFFLPPTLRTSLGIC